MTVVFINSHVSIYQGMCVVSAMFQLTRVLKDPRHLEQYHLNIFISLPTFHTKGFRLVLQNLTLHSKFQHEIRMI